MTEIKDGIYGHVSGTVGRTFQYSGGEAFVVEVAREGSQYPDRVTVWGLGAVTGDRVSLKGWLSWRREVKDDKTYFNVSLNKPQVVAHEESEQTGPEQPAQSASSADGWNTPSFNDETPF